MYALAALVALLLLSIVYSAGETAYSALSRARLRSMVSKQRGARRAHLALSLHEDFDRLLSTCLVGTNVVNLTAASICAVLFVRTFGDIGATMSTIVLTPIVIIFCEVSPKVLAKQSPERVAVALASFIKLNMIVLYPANLFFGWWRKLLDRFFDTSGYQAFTEEELLTILDEANEAGTIDAEDKRLLYNAMEFYDRQAKDIFTPRMDVVALQKGENIDTIAKTFKESGFSRIPVHDASLDNVIGILHLSDFMAHALSGNDIELDKMVSPAVFVSEHVHIRELFALLQQAKSHIAVVIDDQGGTEGIVTMEDILEELVGEIWDEKDKIIENFIEIDQGSYRVSCSTHMDDLIRYFGLPRTVSPKGHNTPPTLNGWIMQMLGKIPQEGDSFTFDKIEITVNKAEPRRALECIIQVNILS